jgi:hypothetical protein
MSLELSDIFDLLGAVRELRTQGFAGLGIIYYRSISDLPIMSLAGDSHDAPRLPVLGRSEVARVLAEVSDRSSRWHDGFHLLDASNGSLTHLSQFVSPPLVVGDTDLASLHPRGAREMAAILTSRISSVVAVAVIRTDGEVSVFRAGSAVQLTEP